jgi:hypothetical protein
MRTILESTGCCGTPGGVRRGDDYPRASEFIRYTLQKALFALWKSPLDQLRVNDEGPKIDYMVLVVPEVREGEPLYEYALMTTVTSQSVLVPIPEECRASTSQSIEALTKLRWKLKWFQQCLTSELEGVDMLLDELKKETT